MATGGEKKVGYSLATVGTLTLEETIYEFPEYISIVVCQDKIVVLDRMTDIVYIHRLHDGKCLAMSDRLESEPRDMCLMDAMTICVLDGGGLIKMMSIDSTDMSPVFSITRSLRLQGVLDEYRGVVRFNNNLVVTGAKQGMMYWCIVSLEDGHVDTIHQICKGDGLYKCRVTTKDNIIYISCDAGDNTGVYGFDILNPSQCKYTYKHQRLQIPTSIVINEDGNIFVCNYRYPDSCIHQLTASCQLVAIFTQGIPPGLRAIFWDNGRLYGTRSGSHDITVFKPVYQEGLIHRLMRSLGLGRSQKKHPIKHSQGEQTVPEVLVSDERKQPVTEKTSTVKEQGVVDQRHSSVESEVPPAIQVPLDSDVDNQGSAIPVEILRMDDKSLQLYKEALQDGKEKVYNIRVMVVGQYGVGKTTLTKRLLGQQVDISERTSTEGIDVYKHCCKIALDTGEWIIQHEDSEQLFRVQRLMKLLTHHTEKPEVNNEQRGQTEVIFQRETIEDLYCPVHDSDSDDDDTSAIISQSDLEQEADNTKHQPGESSSFKVDQILPAKDSSGVNIQEGGRHVTSKVNATMEFLQLVVEKADKLEKSLVEYAALAMWDFAGQYVFYTTHQTFLTCRAIYLLVTDLTQHITDFVKDDECYFDTEGLKPCKVQDLVEVWLNSVHCCAQSSAAGTDFKPENAVTSLAADIQLTSQGPSTPLPSLDVVIPVTPPVILVGTHVDKIQQDKRQEVVSKYFQQICRILKDKPSLQHLVGFIAIDNTQLDPQLETLKKRIFQLASRQPYWGEELPANWLPLEEALMKLKASGIKVIPHSLVEKLNEAGAVPIKTTEQVDLFLRFQHETGNILYFSVQSLREWIVLDPKWLIDALKSLITAETFVLNNNPAARSMWFEFKENGKLTSQLIDAIWTKEKHPEFHDNKEIILQLMEKLNIVARPRLYNPDAEEVKVEGYFLAPCMLRQATPKDLISLGPNSQQRNTSVICFVFTGKFLPTPVFHRLLAACVAQWPIAKQNMENLIFCGCCLFDLDLHHRLTLLFREHGIFARVTIIGTTENALSYKLFIKVREFLTRTLCSIIGCLGQSLQFELSIQCPQSDRYSVDYQIPVATLQGNVDVPCHFHDKSHVIISHDLLKFWFQEEEQSADGSSAVPVPTPPAGDTDRFMRLTYLLVDVGSRILRQLLSHHTVTPTCTLDQYLAKNRGTINSLLKRKVLHQSQMDILFPPNGGNTNLEDYDVTLLSTLFNNIVPSLTQQEDGMIKSLREDRNKLYGHAKSCKMNAMEYQTCWNSISSTLITLSQQCGDPNFQNEISQEIQQIQVSAIPTGSYLDILKTWFSTIETVKGSLETVKGSLETAEGAIQALASRVGALELKKTAEEQSLDGCHDAHEVQESNEWKQPVRGKTATQAEQEGVHKGQPIIETEMPPSLLVHEDYEDKQASLLMEKFTTSAVAEMTTWWNYTAEDLIQAWQSVEDYILEELAPGIVLPFFEKEGVLSSEDYEKMLKLRRRQMAEMLLQRIKAKLPGSFSYLFHALNETKEDLIVQGLRQQIEGPHDPTSMSHDQETNAMTTSIVYYTLTLELLKDGNILHETETKTRVYLNKDCIMFDHCLRSRCVTWKAGSIIVCLKPLGSLTKEGLRFFCVHNGIRNFVSDLLRRKIIFSSLPDGEMTIHIQVHCYDKDSLSEGADGQCRDYTQLNVKATSFTVTDNPEVIKTNLSCLYDKFLEEIDPLHFKDTFVTRQILDECFFDGLQNLEQRRKRAAHFLETIMDKGNKALTALVLALRNHGYVYLANDLCTIQESASQFGYEGEADSSSIDVVSTNWTTHAQEPTLCSCMLKATVRKNEDAGILRKWCQRQNSRNSKAHTQKENQKAPEILEIDARKCPVTAETFTQTEQGFLHQFVEQRESAGAEEDQVEEGQDDAPITQEHINHTRLCNALTTVCADALREILVNQIPVPYANIYQAILANEANLTRKLNDDQRDVVFPDTPGTTGTVDQFDISLLYTILRNISSVPVPTTGWGNPPLDQPRDTSLGASVERIRFHRNAVSGHSVDGKIGEAEFKDYWHKIDHVLCDIESVIGVRGYRVQLEKRKNQVITPHEAHQLQSQLQEYQKQVEDAKEKLRIAMEAVQKLLP